MPFFSIIITTHKRPENLQNAVYSVLLQTYQNFEIIIINDSPEDKNYNEFERNIKDKRIIYIKNEKNNGVNFSKNKALSSKSIKSDWVIFLDDNNILESNTLEKVKDYIFLNKEAKWVISNKADKNGVSFTKIDKEDIPLRYDINFLILKKFSGNVAHCIHKDVIRNIFFPKTIRQGEDWLFFYELSTKTDFYYYNFNSTLINWDDNQELNYRKRSKDERLDVIELLWKEGIERKINKKPTFVIYIIIRLIKAFTKN